MEALRHELPFPEVTLQPLEGERLLITLEYRALAHLLEPFLYEERTGWFSLDKDNMRRWLRRLC